MAHCTFSLVVRRSPIRFP